MVLAQNLTAAEDAVRWVKSLNLWASNRRSDRLAEAGGIDTALANNMVLGDMSQGQLAGDVTDLRGTTVGPSVVRDSAGKKVKNQLGKLEGLSLTDVLNNVATIWGQHRGNCMEQAELAFAHIYANCPAARPLDLMYFRNPTYDHVWVGVGLAPGWNTVSPIKIGARTMGQSQSAELGTARGLVRSVAERWRGVLGRRSDCWEGA